MKEKIKRSAEKLVGFWTSSRTGTAAGIVFMLSMLPILYLGLYNRATGDDFWYGVHTYRGLQENGIIGALKGSFQTVAEFYQSWQGTWFTMFLFTLSPHHFHPAAYMITVFLSMGMLCGSFALLADFYLVKKLKFTRGAATVIVCTLLYLAIQYIPRTTSGIFWFNGVMHYSVPFLLASLAIVHSHKFLDAGRKKDYIISLVCFILLGGGSYLAPVAATLAVFFIMLAKAVSEAGACKDRKKLFLSFKPYLMIFVAFFLELIGLIVSFLAPGNKVRGGEEFGMDLKWALQCIYGAIDRGIYLGEDYFKNNLVIVIAFILLAVLIWGQLWRTDRRENAFRFPLFFVIYMNGIYWASYVPEIYSRSDVSGGVPNTYFHFFLIVTLANVIYVHGWVQDQLIKYWKRKAEKQKVSYEEIERKSIWGRTRYKKCFLAPITAAGGIVLLMAVLSSEITTTDEYCIDFITSGKLARYTEVRKEQFRILSDETISDAVIPEVWESQYPLCHIALKDTMSYSFNADQARYYGKNSVIAYQAD